MQVCQWQQLFLSWYLLFSFNLEWVRFHHLSHQNYSLLLKGILETWETKKSLTNFKATSLLNNRSCELDFKYDYRCSLSTCQSGNRRSKFPYFWRNHFVFHHLCDVMCSRNQRKNNKVGFYIDIDVGFEHPKISSIFNRQHHCCTSELINTWAQI